MINNTQELIILVGPPGSGKSTYAKEKYPSYFYINQDSQGKEEHLKLFKEALKENKNIIVDRMNFNKDQRNRYLQPAKDLGYKSKIIVFHVPKQTCIDRCIDRQDHPTIKLEEDAYKAVNFFFKSYERVEDNEADEIERLGWLTYYNPIIVSDLDGTLCNLDHRLHFIKNEKKDWKSFFNNLIHDTPNDWCLELLKGVRGHNRILFCSGRPDSYRKQTEEWLDENIQSDYEYLFMRSRNDFRQDDIVKEIILEFEIKTRYTVLCWIDDRKQVVDKIRSHGITVLQCAPGDF